MVEVESALAGLERGIQPLGGGAGSDAEQRQTQLKGGLVELGRAHAKGQQQPLRDTLGRVATTNCGGLQRNKPQAAAVDAPGLEQILKFSAIGIARAE